MDLREKKTRRSITNAFLQLRQTKPLERITVKELSELAEISKATFYLHYQDIYDLSDTLQNEVIQDILQSIPHPEYLLTDLSGFTLEVFHGFYARQNLVEILFAGNQSAVLPTRIDRELRAYIHRHLPDADPELDMRLTYQILGSYYVYENYREKYGMEQTIRFVAGCAEALNGHKPAPRIAPIN